MSTRILTTAIILEISNPAAARAVAVQTRRTMLSSRLPLESRFVGNTNSELPYKHWRLELSWLDVAFFTSIPQRKDPPTKDRNSDSWKKKRFVPQKPLILGGPWRCTFLEFCTRSWHLLLYAMNSSSPPWKNCRVPTEWIWAWTLLVSQCVVIIKARSVWFKKVSACSIWKPMTTIPTSSNAPFSLLSPTTLSMFEITFWHDRRYINGCRWFCPRTCYIFDWYFQTIRNWFRYNCWFSGFQYFVCNRNVFAPCKGSPVVDMVAVVPWFYVLHYRPCDACYFHWC